MRHPDRAAVTHRGDPFQLSKARKHGAPKLTADMVPALCPVETLASKAGMPRFSVAEPKADLLEPLAAAIGKREVLRIGWSEESAALEGIGQFDCELARQMRVAASRVLQSI